MVNGARFWTLSIRKPRPRSIHSSNTCRPCGLTKNLSICATSARISTMSKSYSSARTAHISFMHFSNHYIIFRTEPSSKDGHPRQKRSRIPLKRESGEGWTKSSPATRISQDRGEIFYTKIPRSIDTKVVEPDDF